MRLGRGLLPQRGAASSTGSTRDPGFRLERDVPSRVAERLHAGEIDLGIIPSIEYAFGDYAIVPGIAIASRGPVRSVSLFHRGPLERVRRVALDTSSRTSVALAEGAAARAAGPRPAVRADGAVPRSTCWRVADAALLIGDPALDHEGAVAAARPGRGVAAPHRAAVRVRLLGGPAGRRRPRRRAAPAGGARRRARGARRRSPSATPARRRPRARRRTSRTCATNIVYRAGGGGAGGPARVLPPRPRPRRSSPAVPELRFHARCLTRSRRKVARGRAALARGGRGPPPRRRLPRARAARRRGALAPAPRARRHLHHRPQHQLHERLHRPVRLLRLLPRPALEGGLRPHEGASSRRRSRRRSRSAAAQILLQGGLHPDLGIEYYEELFRWMKATYPIWIHGLSPAEVKHIAQRLEAVARRRRCGG